MSWRGSEVKKYNHFDEKCSIINRTLQKNQTYFQYNNIDIFE